MEQIPDDDMLKDAPEFKKMMADALREKDLIKDRIERIVPIIKPGKGPANKIVTSDGRSHEVPQGALPVLFTLPFDEDFSIVFGIDEGTHYEWLQNNHIEAVKDQISVYDLLNKAYENLFRNIQHKLSIRMINDHVGMLVDGDALESSLVLTGEIWTSIRSAINAEDVVFAIPTQDVFVFVRADQGEEVEQMREKVKEIFENPDSPKKLSNKLYLRKTNGEITLLSKSIL